ncbi:MAG: hypothetical protein LBK82_04675 [Planctomycetaceae bacterium]|nr:hypothetical protein [Planctomycetaceae bacterium]
MLPSVLESSTSQPARPFSEGIAHQSFFHVFRVQKHLKRNPEILRNRYYLFVNRERYREHDSNILKNVSKNYRVGR